MNIYNWKIVLFYFLNSIIVVIVLINIIKLRIWEDIFMKCFVAPSYVVETISNRYHYHIPCTLTSQNIGKLADGTYCIEIVKKLVGDIDSENFVRMLILLKSPIVIIYQV